MFCLHSHLFCVMDPLGLVAREVQHVVKVFGLLSQSDQLGAVLQGVDDAVGVILKQTRKTVKLFHKSKFKLRKICH